MAELTMKDLFDGLKQFSGARNSDNYRGRRVLRENDEMEDEYEGEEYPEEGGEEMPPMDMEFDDFGSEGGDMGDMGEMEVPEGGSLEGMEDEDVVVIDTSEFKPEDKDYFVVSVDKDKDLDLEDELPKGAGVEEKIEIVEDEEDEEEDEEGEEEDEDEEDEEEEDEEEGKKEVEERRRILRQRNMRNKVREWKMAKYRSMLSRRSRF